MNKSGAGTRRRRPPGAREAVRQRRAMVSELGRAREKGPSKRPFPGPAWREQAAPAGAYLKPKAVRPPSTSWTIRMPSATTGLPRMALRPALARPATSPLSVFNQCR